MPEVSATAEEKISDYREYIDIADKMMTNLEFTPEDKIRAFNFGKRSITDWESFKRQMKKSIDPKVQSCADLIIDLYSHLDGVLGTDLAVQKAWLSTVSEHLGTQTKLQLIHSGRLGIAMVTVIFDLITGKADVHDDEMAPARIREIAEGKVKAIEESVISI